MIIDKLENFTNGWFIGNFDPALLKSTDMEIAVQHTPKGTLVEHHFQKTATEYNVIISGTMRVENNILSAGDIFVYLPNEVCNVEVLEDTVTVVVKTPSVGASDKVVVDD